MVWAAIDERPERGPRYASWVQVYFAVGADERDALLDERVDEFPYLMGQDRIEWGTAAPTAMPSGLSRNCRMT
jgi:hypothetical protein